MTNLLDRYPIHTSIWLNDTVRFIRSLEECLPQDLERLDPRGRTPLLLAISLGRRDMAHQLIERDVCLDSADKFGFNALHEAIMIHDADLVKQILGKREEQRNNKRVDFIPNILARLRDTPDFYVEMKWEFSSWLPLVSRVCPSDIYRIYKSGTNVRVDTTLVGFDGSWNWLRGHRSFVFKATEDKSTLMIINHENGKYLSKNVVLSSVSPSPSEQRLSTCGPETLDRNRSNLDHIAQYRMYSPVKLSYVDTDQISFDRAKSGILGFRSDKNETINGYECRVFTANNIARISRVRVDHLNENERADAIQEENESFEAKLAPFQYLLAGRETQRLQPPAHSIDEPPKDEYNPYDISMEEYFGHDVNLEDRDIGHYKYMNSYIQKFRANVWMCDDFPLSLREQVAPIIDLMAANSPHFSKLRDFISLQLPHGFPVKIEIPLFHLVTAVVTFGNIFAMEEPVSGVTPIKDEVTTACVVDDVAFYPPPGYVRAGEDDDFEALIFASQSDEFEGPSQEEIWASLKNENLDKVIEASKTDLTSTQTNTSQCETPISNGYVPSHTATQVVAPTEPLTEGTESIVSQEPPEESRTSSRFSSDEIQRALQLSLEEMKEYENRLKNDEKQFEGDLERAFALSLEDTAGPSHS